MDTLIDQRITYTPSYPTGKFRVLQMEIALTDKPDAKTLKAMETIALDSTHETYPLPECYAMLGKIRRVRGDLAGAESALTTGMKLTTGDTTGCLVELVEVYRRMGRPAQEKQVRVLLRKAGGETPELAALRRAAQQKPQDTAALLALAKGLEEAGKTGEAADAYQAILAISPQDPTALAQKEPLRRKALEHLDETSRKIVAETGQ
jgi:cytochrome c-type biogenesis protein CcmH/NrfG